MQPVIGKLCHRALWGKASVCGLGAKENEVFMTAQVMVYLPEDVFQRAARLAQLTSRALSEVLVDTLDLSLPALGQPDATAEALSKLSNEAILKLTQLEMSQPDNQRLSELLYQQQAHALSDPQRLELAHLMRIYQDGLLRKAQALAEAVKRGLLVPITP